MVFKSLRWIGVLAVTALLTVGCSDDVSTIGPDDDVTELELEDDLGGYTATNEPELSGDAVVGAFAGADGMVSDPLAGDPEFAAALDGASFYNVYFVRLAWGVLPQDDVGGTPGRGGDGPEVDWTGSLESSAGAVIALRTILFERSTDRLVFPRDDRTLLEFESKTFGHWDGMLVAVAIPEDEDDGTATLTFSTEPFEVIWTFAELDSMNQVYDTDVADHEVSVISMKRKPGDRIQGFVMGRWTGSHDAGGTFRGVWVSFDGYTMGFLRGHYGVRGRDAHHVLYGKYFNDSGEFLGFIRGGYARADRPHVGIFRALWLDENESEDGFMKGHWVNIPRTNRGFFSGRWGLRGPEDGGGNGGGPADGTPGGTEIL